MTETSFTIELYQNVIEREKVLNFTENNKEIISSNQAGSWQEMVSRTHYIPSIQFSLSLTFSTKAE